MNISGFLPSMKTRETLEEFINRSLEIPKDFKAKINQTIDHVQRHLETMTKYKVEKVIRGGSIAKGTAVQTMLDIDLIVFISGYCTRQKPSMKNMEDFVKDKRKNGGILCCLKEHLTSDAIGRFLRNFKCTRESVGYHLALEMVENTKIKVDIIPAINICNVDETMGPIYSKMNKHSSDILPHFSSCLAEKQCKFIRDQPKPVRNLIKLVKYWKKINNLSLRSYCCELLCVWVFRHDLHQDVRFPMKTGFIAVLNHLTNYNDLQVTFNDYYNPNKKIPTDILGIKPYVIDPANPFMNTCIQNLTSGDTEKITTISRQTIKALG